MSEIKYTAQDVEAAARSVGYSPTKTTNHIREEQIELVDALKVGTFPSPLEPLKRVPEAHKPSRTRRALGIVAAAGALTAGAVGLFNKIDNGVPTTGETVTYTVQPGDTADELGHQIEAGIDGIAENQDARPMIDDIFEQSNHDGHPGLQVGEKIEVPAAADYDPTGNVSLTHK